MGAMKAVLFQFLMVRLKDYDWYFVPLRLLVSIPYGTIKRFVEPMFRRGMDSFNSLWYD